MTSPNPKPLPAPPPRYIRERAQVEYRKYYAEAKARGENMDKYDPPEPEGSSNLTPASSVSITLKSIESRIMLDLFQALEFCGAKPERENMFARLNYYQQRAASKISYMDDSPYKDDPTYVITHVDKFGGYFLFKTADDERAFVTLHQFIRIVGECKYYNEMTLLDWENIIEAHVKESAPIRAAMARVMTAFKDENVVLSKTDLSHKFQMGSKLQPALDKLVEQGQLNYGAIPRATGRPAMVYWLGVNGAVADAE